MFSNRFAVLTLQTCEVEEQNPSEISSDGPASVPSKKHSASSRSLTSPLSLCNVCNTMYQALEDDVLSGEHHSSNDNLLAAARNRCYVCLILNANMNKLSLNLQPNNKVSSENRRGLFWYFYHYSPALCGIIVFRYHHDYLPSIKILDLTWHQSYGTYLSPKTWL